MNRESSPSRRKIASYAALFLIFGVCTGSIIMWSISLLKYCVRYAWRSVFAVIFFESLPLRQSALRHYNHCLYYFSPLSPLPKLENERGKRKDSTAKPDRLWGEQCSNSDIVIIQGPAEPLPSGIPTYTVEIMNICLSGQDISRIHLSCGWFSSARLVNPRIFKRLRFDDCLVNDGKPLLNGRTLSFRYANTFSYPLAVSSVTC